VGCCVQSRSSSELRAVLHPFAHMRGSFAVHYEIHNLTWVVLQLVVKSLTQAGVLNLRRDTVAEPALRFKLDRIQLITHVS
jgi:hypothetical protein